MIVFLNNKFVPESKAHISILDSGFLYGCGIYETMRTYNGKLKNLKNHFSRLNNSAKIIGLNKIPFQEKDLENWIYKLMQKNNINEAKIRLTVTPGSSGFDQNIKSTPTILIQTIELEPIPKKLLKDGVSAITYKINRILPEAKTTCLLPQILARKEMNKKMAYEVLLINQKGNVTEGSITNFYIIKNHTLITPDKDILEGTTRTQILKIARKLLKIELRDVKPRELYTADECFISNAPRGIIPVVKIDGRKIEDGKPGGYTKRIINSF